MEIFELRYFLGVARFENVHRASEALKISPGSLSKAVTRLEDELSVKLFRREGRNIQLTDQGRVLQKRASELLQLEESAKLEIAGHLGSIHAVLAGPEVLLSKMGVDLVTKIKKKFPLADFEFLATDDETALREVKDGNAHFALVTQEVASKADFKFRILEETTFETYVGILHPLYVKAKSKRPVKIDELLEYPFVSPSHPVLGKVGARQSLDGWRDDRFQRRVEYRTSSLKLLEELVVSGRAIGYLPTYFCKGLALEALKVSGCPYSCTQKVKLVTRNSQSVGWINQIF